MDDTEFRMIMSKLTDINNTLHRIGKEGGNEIRKINITVEKIFQSVEYKIKSIDHNCYKLNDIESYLEDNSEWNGVGGDWIVCLGEESSAMEGRDDSLPSASAMVNDLSRLWFGSASAEAVALTGNFKASSDLIAQINTIVQLPAPIADWDF